MRKILSETNEKNQATQLLETAMRLPNLPLRVRTLATTSTHLSPLIITASAMLSSTATDFFSGIPETSLRASTGVVLSRICFDNHQTEPDLRPPGTETGRWVTMFREVGFSQKGNNSGRIFPRPYNSEMPTSQAAPVNLNHEFIEVCEKSARAGARALLAWKGRFKVREKGPADLVTDADLASQEAIRAIVLGAFPEHDFIAEEDTGPSVRQSAYRWIVDPLDGTTNYVHGVPQYAVSIALEHDGHLLVATVYDPSTDECFTAVRGAGARLNGELFRTSGAVNMGQALVAVSFPSQVEPGTRPLVDFEKVIIRSRAIRRSGSAALNLCYVACGRYDAYFARETKAWDVAAGALLITEAGGTITALNGQPFSLERPTFIAAASAALHAELFALVGDRV